MWLMMASLAWADCRIHNQTSESWSVSSGPITNQKVNSYSISWIHAGVVQGTAKSGKTMGGSCEDGDRLKVVYVKNQPVLLKEK